MSQSSYTSSSLDRFRRGDRRAFERICERYYERLAQIAQRRLRGSARRVVDERAIANDALHEFYTRSQRGDFPDVTSHDELFPLLVRMTHDRVVDELRRHTAIKRGGGLTRGDSVLVAAPGYEQLKGVRDLVDTPSTRQIVEEELAAILQRLPDEKMRAILLLRTEGFTNDEIAEELRVSVATVERKRRRIRDVLSDL